MIRTVNDLRKAYPNMVAQVEKEATEKEQNRISALRALDNDEGISDLRQLIEGGISAGIPAEKLKPIADSIKERTANIDFMVNTMNKMNGARK